MKIDSNYKPAPLATPPAPAPRPAPAPPSTSVDVTLSAVAAQLKAGSEGAPVDVARVREIKAAMAEGRFQINAGAIADSLIATARELIDRQRNNEA